MKTQTEVQTKLQILRDSRDAFSREDQLHSLDAQIRRLEWVLGIESDKEVLVWFCNRLKPQLDRIETLLIEEKKENRKLMSQITDWAAKEQASLNSISTTLDAVSNKWTATDIKL